MRIGEGDWNSCPEATYPYSAICSNIVKRMHALRRRAMDTCIIYWPAPSVYLYVVYLNITTFGQKYWPFISMIMCLSISTCYLYLVLYPTQTPLFNSGPDILSASYMNMLRNCRKNSSRLGSSPPTNPAPLLLRFDNLFTKGRIKYGVTVSVRVQVRVSINIKLLVLHFILLYSLDGDSQ